MAHFNASCSAWEFSNLECFPTVDSGTEACRPGLGTPDFRQRAKIGANFVHKMIFNTKFIQRQEAAC